MLNSVITLVTSERERQAVLEQVPKARPVVVPRPVPLRPTLLPFAARTGLLFVGDLYSASDVDGLLWFMDHVLGPLRTEVVARARSQSDKNTDANSMSGAIEALARASAAATRDVVLHVVQLDGRPLPKALHPRLLANSSLTSVLKASHAESSETDENSAPFIIIHDDLVLDASASRPHTQKPYLTVAHRTALAAFTEAADAEAAAVMASDGTTQAGGNTKPATAKSEKDDAIDLKIARMATAAAMWTGRVLLVIVKATLRLTWAGLRSAVFGDPLDWAWVTKDVSLWWAQLWESSGASTVGVDGAEAANSKVFDGFGAPSFSEEGRSTDALHNLDVLFRAARVVVLPLHRTPGAFTQVTSAWCRGVPIVATSAVAATVGSISESPAGSEAPIMIADDPVSFIEAVSSIYVSPHKWTATVAAGYKRLNEDSSLSALVKQTAVLVAMLIDSKPTTMAAAAALRPRGGQGVFSAFSRQVDFGRRALGMKTCSSDHTNDLLTFAPAGPAAPATPAMPVRDGPRPRAP